jgi:hypothetical protein
VNECVRFSFQPEDCPVERLIGLQDFLLEAKTIVMDELLKITGETGGYRVAPLVISRLARGGKTTALCMLFDALETCQVEGVDVNVMLISFNGSTNFIPMKGESQTHSIIRNIVWQLIDHVGVDQRCIKCSADILDTHIGSSPFVLLIDELNAIAETLDGDAGHFLRTMFLDKKNRYLVFTSHIPMNVDPKLSGYMVGSDRGVKSISLPVSTDLTMIRKMPGCEAVNAATAALYGGIPSLIYSVFYLNELKPETRFSSSREIQKLNRTKEEMMMCLKDFVKAVVSGTQKDTLKVFYEFAITTADAVQWPLCYIQCILGLFPETRVIKFILSQCHNLATYSSSTGLGLDWEAIVNIALGFRCLHQELLHSGSPFDIVPAAGTLCDDELHVFAFSLPDEVKTIEMAKEHIYKRVNNTTPALVLANPTFGSFPAVDGFVAHCVDSQQMTLYGYQVKLGHRNPTRNVRNLDKGIYLQGNAEQIQNAIKGWECWNKEQIQVLLGCSLKYLYPADWSSCESLAAAEEDDADEFAVVSNKKSKSNK